MVTEVNFILKASKQIENAVKYLKYHYPQAPVSGIIQALMNLQREVEIFIKSEEYKKSYDELYFPADQLRKAYQKASEEKDG